jgi:hypothetical protein
VHHTRRSLLRAILSPTHISILWTLNSRNFFFSPSSHLNLSLSLSLSLYIYIYIYIVHAKLLMEENSSSAQNREKQPDMEREEGMMSSSAVGRRERLRRLRSEIGGQVCIPDTWGQETSLQDWADCTAFALAYVPAGLALAQAALAEEARQSAITLIDPVGE